MKKLLFICVFISIILFSCIPAKFENIKPEDYSLYIYNESDSFSGSPLSYSVLKGNNPYLKYDWKQVHIYPYWFTHYSGDPSKLLNAYYPNSDIILYFNSVYYIGTLNE